MIKFWKEAMIPSLKPSIQERHLSDLGFNLETCEQISWTKYVKSKIRGSMGNKNLEGNKVLYGISPFRANEGTQLTKK